MSELVESLLYEWEESAPPSNAIQQLVSLLCKALFFAHDKIATRSYTPELPEIPFEVDDDDGIAIKIVRLVKANEALGATIKCDTNGSVFIARIIAGGVADRSGCVQVGDRVMEVNGNPVTGMKPSDIVKLLSTGNGSVTFKLIPTDIPTTIDYAEKRYVRSLVDYSSNKDTMHPCPEAALSFTRGEILELIVTDDEHWWQARSFGYGAFASSESVERKVGLIPSELLYEKRRALRDSTRNSMRRTSKNMMYESVVKLAPARLNQRPIILIGPPGVGRNELRKRLIMKNGERYATTVPHTSRPPRIHEIDGVDYYFVSRSEMEKDIRQGKYLEFGEYRGNLYGTLADSVLAVMKQGRVPVLNPHHLALRILRSSMFRPFIVFVKPPSLEQLTETRSHSKLRLVGNKLKKNGSGIFAQGCTDFEQMIATSEQLWQLYGHYFDAIIENGNIDQAFCHLCQFVDKLDTESTWVPSDWAE
ncbi:unnamed protein product [Dracunculus medinensis]|uniref:MAGUK p55 subfamily member 7 n=1 Tax=Dracunculus medinensis TaxID=318479 RepID=A0A3P7Q9R0_DRAME|nr:unnamed protein product [Dracunculus medinensis]